MRVARTGKRTRLDNHVIACARESCIGCSTHARVHNKRKRARALARDDEGKVEIPEMTVVLGEWVCVRRIVWFLSVRDACALAATCCFMRDVVFFHGEYWRDRAQRLGVPLPLRTDVGDARRACLRVSLHTLRPSDALLRCADAGAAMRPVLCAALGAYLTSGGVLAEDDMVACVRVLCNRDARAVCQHSEHRGCLLVADTVLHGRVAFFIHTGVASAALGITVTREPGGAILRSGVPTADVVRRYHAWIDALTTPE